MENKREILTLNTQDNIILDVVKGYFHSSIDTIFNEINNWFDYLTQMLNKKGIDYYKLKSALIPCHQQDRYEYCFVFDGLNSEDDFSCKVINKIFTLLNNDTVQCIFAGDYIAVSDISYNYIYEILENEINYSNNEYSNKRSEYFIIYVNNISKPVVDNIVSELKKEQYFIGDIDLTYSCELKDYLSLILPQLCIKYKKTVIIPHSADYEDTKNVNDSYIDYENCGYSFISINEMYYNIFLEYKIQRSSSELSDVLYGYNSITTILPDIYSIIIEIEDEKLEYLKKDDKGKILKSLGLLDYSTEELVDKIQEQIKQNYIYRLRKNNLNNLLLNIMIELEDYNSESKRKVVLAFEYKEYENTLRLTTMY